MGIVPPTLRRDLARAARMGRHGDTNLVHVNPAEERMLRAVSGRPTKNPKTGRDEYFVGGISDGAARDAMNRGGWAGNGPGGGGGGGGGKGTSPGNPQATTKRMGTTYEQPTGPYSASQIDKTLSNWEKANPPSWDGPLDTDFFGHLASDLFGLHKIRPDWNNPNTFSAGRPHWGVDLGQLATGAVGAVTGLPLGAVYGAGKWTGAIPRDFAMMQLGGREFDSSIRGDTKPGEMGGDTAGGQVASGGGSGGDRGKYGGLADAMNGGGGALAAAGAKPAKTPQDPNAGLNPWDAYGFHNYLLGPPPAPYQPPTIDGQSTILPDDTAMTPADRQIPLPRLRQIARGGKTRRQMEASL